MDLNASEPELPRTPHSMLQCTTGLSSSARRVCLCLTHWSKPRQKRYSAIHGDQSPGYTPSKGWFRALLYFTAPQCTLQCRHTLQHYAEEQRSHCQLCQDPLCGTSHHSCLLGSARPCSTGTGELQYSIKDDLVNFNLFYLTPQFALH